MIKHFTQAARHLSLALLLFVNFSLTYAQEISTEEADISAGKALFDTNCKTCHRVHQKLVGPQLAGVYDRAPSIDWIKSFVKNSSAVIASGDDYAV
jgi:cytochrome c2